MPTACRCNSSPARVRLRKPSWARTGAAYGLSQSRGSLPSGPVTVMVHIASVWVPFTSESKEAVASYPEIQKELRLGLQAVGRKLADVRPPQAAGQAGGDRRADVSCVTWAKWPRPRPRSKASIAQPLYDRLVEVAKRKTAEADVEARQDTAGRSRRLSKRKISATMC